MTRRKNNPNKSGSESTEREPHQRVDLGTHNVFSLTDKGRDYMTEAE